MNLMRSLALPFQLAALLFTGFSALVLTLLFTFGSDVSPLRALGVYVITIWLNRFAFALLEASANGETEVPVASVEMLGPFGDVRSWMHPLLAGSLFVALLLIPSLPRVPVLTIAALLWPLSLAAVVFSDRGFDAVNPLAWWRTLRGLAAGYPLLLAALATAAVVTWSVWQLPLPRFLRFAVTAQLFLCYYAFVGTTLHWRRNELGFEPRHSPERAAERVAQERTLERQRMIDAVFVAVRARRMPDARALLGRWFESAPAETHGPDTRALLSAGTGWNEPRGLAALADFLIERHCNANQTAQAFAMVEQILPHLPSFRPAEPRCVVMLIRHAARTGRGKLAQQWLARSLEDATAENRPLFEELQRELAR